MPLESSVPHVDECTGRTFLRDHEAVSFQLQRLSLMVAVFCSTVFDMPEIEPQKVIPAVSEIPACIMTFNCAMADKPTEYYPALEGWA
jgi:hypothetical protein